MPDFGTNEVRFDEWALKPGVCNVMLREILTLCQVIAIVRP